MIRLVADSLRASDSSEFLDEGLRFLVEVAVKVGNASLIASFEPVVVKKFFELSVD